MRAGYAGGAAAGLDPRGARRRAGELLDEARREARGGSLERAWQLSRSAAAIGRELGDAQIVARAALAVDAPGLAAWSAIAARQSACLEALGMLGPAPGDLRRLVELQLAAIDSAWLERPAEPGERPSADRTALEFAELRAAHTGALGPAGVGARLELAARTKLVGAAGGDEQIVAWGRLWRLDALLQLGLRAEWNTEYIAFESLVARLQSPSWSWRLALARTCLALLEDRVDDAVPLAAEALALGEACGAPDAAFFGLIVRAELATRTGDGLAPIEAEVARAIAGAPFVAQGWRARILAALGRRDAAVDLWRAIAPHIGSMPETVVEWLVAEAGHAELAVLARDRDAARAIRQRLEPYAHLHVTATVLGPYSGPVSLALATLARSLGDDAAQERWALDAEARAVAVGSRTTAAAARALRAPAGGLTPREAEVAALVARGRTNREISDRARALGAHGRAARAEHPATARRAEPRRGRGLGDASSTPAGRLLSVARTRSVRRLREPWVSGPDRARSPTRSRDPNRVFGRVSSHVHGA